MSRAGMNGRPHSIYFLSEQFALLPHDSRDRVTIEPGKLRLEGLAVGEWSAAIIRKEAEAAHSDHHNGRHGPRSRRCGQPRIAPHNGMKAVRWHGLRFLISSLNNIPAAACR